MKNLLTILLLFLVHFVNGQSGIIQGSVTDKDNEPVMFANIQLVKNDVIIVKKQTNNEGFYRFDHLDARVYNVEVSYVGYSMTRILNVMISENEQTQLNINLYQDCFIVEIPHKKPVINSWNLTQGTTFSSDEIQRSPHKN